MRSPIRKLLLPALALLTVPLVAQGDEQDWRMPFRHPDQKLEPPQDVFDELRTMFARAKNPRVRKYFDETGREVCDDQAWRDAHSRLLRLKQDAGYLSQVIRLSGTPEHRQLALYGSFYNPDDRLVMQMLNHIPGEPLRPLREDGMRRAIEFIRVHLGKKNPGDLEEWSKLRVGPAGGLPPKPGEWTYEFDAVPFFVLLTVDSPLDQQQALWFLGEVVKVRPDLWQPYLAAAGPTLYPLIVHDDRTVREAACEFAQLVDPEHREPPSIDGSMDDLNEYLDAIMYDVFPPIRPVAPGLVDLYKSDDLDRIVAIGKQLLENGSLGDTTTGTLPNGQAYRGVRLKRMPAPLDKLGLEVDQIVTAINGVPVASCEEILKTIEGSVSWKRSFFVEYVWNGRMHAKEFRRAN